MHQVGYWGDTLPGVGLPPLDAQEQAVAWDPASDGSLGAASYLFWHQL